MRSEIVSIAGEALELLSERLIWWPGRSTLLAADLHLGKEMFLHSRGVPVPLGGTVHDLGVLKDVVSALRPEEVIILGDLFHAKAGNSIAVLKAFEDVLLNCSCRWSLILGNHDRSCGSFPEVWPVQILKEPLAAGPFILSHEPLEHGGLYNLAGHIHPSVRLRERSGSSVRFPCFYFGEKSGLLPAFGSATGTYTITPRPWEKVFAVLPGEVVDVTLRPTADVSLATSAVSSAGPRRDRQPSPKR